MKHLKIKMLGSFFILCMSLLLYKPLNINNLVNQNINLTYFSLIYQGDIYNLFRVDKVNNINHLVVREYKYQNDQLYINYLSKEVLSPIEGVVIKKGLKNNEKYIVIQSSSSVYQISGFEKLNVALYQYINVSDSLGNAINNNNQYLIIVINQTNNSYTEVCSLVIDYEEV